jgi:hypothetical protein
MIRGGFMLKFSGLSLAAFILIAPVAFSQSNPTPTTSDPQAVTLASQAFAALIGNARINDVTLTGTGTRTAGSDVESGDVTLKALGIGEARLDLIVAGGTRSEIRNLNSNSTPQGFWIGLDGSVHSIANHNCFTDAAWFFPAFSVLSQRLNPNLVATYVGQETRNGAAVQHLRFLVQNGDQTGFSQQLSAEDIYLDASSYLPVALAFNVHPDENAGANIPVEVYFSNYQTVNGVQVPFHIQQLLNGTLLFDLTIQKVILNSGLSDAAFSSN